jgi:signal transduction histidine kinase
MSAIRPSKQADSPIEIDELFRQLLENIYQVSWIVDVHTKELLYVSPAYRELWNHENAQAEDLGRFLAPLEKEVLEPVEESQRIVSPDGSVRWIQWRRVPVRDREGEVYRAVLIGRDVTAQREMEEQLRQADKMEALGRMAGGIAHHFNNLLTIIIGYAVMLRDDTEPEDPRREKVEWILGAADRAAKQTRQLLAFSGHEFFQPKVVKMNSLLNKMKAPLRGALGDRITVETMFRREAGYIRVDPDQLKEAVMELAANARAAMPNGGCFRMETRTAEVAGGQAEEGLGGPRKFVQLRITDSGRGMDGCTRERAFEPFFTKARIGEKSGLGLSTVYGIVQQNGGTIRVYSEPGQGTIFELCFQSVSESDAATPALPNVRADPEF